MYGLVLAEIYIYIIYTYIEYILYRSNIEKYREKCQFIDCFFLSFIDVPKLIMSDSIELHLAWLLPYRGYMLNCSQVVGKNSALKKTALYLCVLILYH